MIHLKLQLTIWNYVSQSNRNLILLFQDLSLYSVVNFIKNTKPPFRFFRHFFLIFMWFIYYFLMDSWNCCDPCDFLAFSNAPWPFNAKLTKMAQYYTQNSTYQIFEFNWCHWFNNLNRKMHRDLVMAHMYVIISVCFRFYMM